MSEYNIHGLPQDMINRFRYSGLIPQHTNAILKNITGMRKVFLGGTVNNSTWRERLIEKLKIRYFDPVVPDWNEEAFQRELEEKEECDYLLIVITPLMTGVFSIAEIVDCSNKHPEKAVFCYLKEDDGKKFDKGQIMSLDKVGEMVEANGGKWVRDFDQLPDVLI